MRRSGVEDLWTKTVRDADGNTQSVPSARDGRGMRWRARYIDERGGEHSKAFGRKVVWSHPAFANRSVYVRNDHEIVCVSLAANP